MRWLWTIPEMCRIAFILYSGFSAIFGDEFVYRSHRYLKSAFICFVVISTLSCSFLPVLSIYFFTCSAHPLIQILNPLLSVLTACFFSRTIYFHLCLLRYRFLPLRLPLSRIYSTFFPVWSQCCTDPMLQSYKQTRYLGWLFIRSQNVLCVSVKSMCEGYAWCSSHSTRLFFKKVRSRWKCVSYRLQDRRLKGKVRN